MKYKGLLLPLASLPSRHGVGDFSKEAFKIIDILKKNGFCLWQMLPLGPLSYGHSPYQSFSSFAFDELYLSLDDLTKRGLLDKTPSFNKNKKRIAFEDVRTFKEKYYYQAFLNYIAKYGYEELDEYANNNKRIEQYAIYVSFKDVNDEKPWNLWTSLKHDETIERRKYYHLFVQLFMLKQWNAIHDYARKMGICLIGDLPFYVAFDSSDLYYNKHLYKLNEDGSPTVVAGVPPDYFSEDGQRWGNPIYNFEEMKKDNYSFLIERLLFASSIYDTVRIDHFRAFDTYCEIPAKDDNARNGIWIEAPGYEIFDELFYRKHDIDLIAEDLGDLRPQVIYLRDHYNLPGMNVLEFTFESIYLTKTLSLPSENSITYIGTHDNSTMMGWLSSLSKTKRTKLRKYLDDEGYKSIDLGDAIIAKAMTTPSMALIISITDVLKLNDSYKLNTPGTLNNRNWSFRLTSYDGLKKALKKRIFHV